MKHRIHILLFLLLLPVAMAAQDNLSIEKVLKGKHRKNPNTTEVKISGASLAEYHLTFYHSLTVVSDLQLMDAVAKAFAEDEKEATDKELSKVGNHIYYGFYRLKYDGVQNRFVFFKDQRYAPSDRKNSVTLIYMEGDTSLSSLKKRFKK